MRFSDISFSVGITRSRYRKSHVFAMGWARDRRSRTAPIIPKGHNTAVIIMISIRPLEVTRIVPQILIDLEGIAY